MLMKLVKLGMMRNRDWQITDVTFSLVFPEPSFKLRNLVVMQEQKTSIETS
jgi:hypothetical protein